MSLLTGKVALISGSACGQGAAEARLFVAEGARVMVTDVREDEGRRTAAELGSAGAFVALDCTSESAWDHAVTETLKHFGRLDILVNNAGISMPGNVESTTLTDYMRLVMVNQVGVFLGMKAALSALKTNGGSVINISSVVGLRGSAGAFGYGATKWAVRGMTKSAAREFAPYGIRVNSVHPAVVDTEMVADVINTPWMQGLIKATPLGRIAQVDDVANLVLFLASDKSSYCTGAEFIVDGGTTA